MRALMEEAHKLGFRVAHHVGVAETDAWDDAAVYLVAQVTDNVVVQSRDPEAPWDKKGFQEGFR